MYFSVLHRFYNCNSHLKSLFYVMDLLVFYSHDFISKNFISFPFTSFHRVSLCFFHFLTYRTCVRLSRPRHFHHHYFSLYLIYPALINLLLFRHFYYLQGFFFRLLLHYLFHHSFTLRHTSSPFFFLSFFPSVCLILSF